MAGIKGEYIYDDDGNIIGATGALKTAMTNKAMYGEDYYASIGKRGGELGTTGGFASEKVGNDGLTGRERAKIAGVKGGKKSKRGKAKEIQWN